jgi:predicted dehydrogenase
VGLGKVSAPHLEAYRALPEVELAGGADPSPAARAHAEEQHGLRTFASVDELLANESVDLLCVLTPTATHRDAVEAAARHDVPVLCEKPLAATLADGEAIVECCARAGIPLAYGSSYRFLPPVAAAHDLVQGGAVGEVALVVETLVGGRGREAQEQIGPAHYPFGTPGGTPMGIVDHGIHFIDVAPWLAGRQVVAASGRGNTSGGELGAEYVALELDGGAHAHLICFDGSWSTALPNEGQWLAGDGWDTSGTLLRAGSWGRDIVELHVYGSDGALRVAPYAHRLYRSGPDGIAEVPVDGPPAPHHFGLQLRAVLGALAAGEPLPVPGEVGLDALRTLHSIYSDEREAVAIGGRDVV